MSNIHYIFASNNKTMKLYKALKLKKKLAGEIAKLQGTIARNNSYVEGNKTAEKCDILAIESELGKKMGELLDLKMAIYKANIPIQKDIYALAEIKGLIVFWEGVNTTEGVYPSGGYSVNSKDTIYIARISEEEKEKRQRELQDKIDTLQENIDAYNYTTDI